MNELMETDCRGCLQTYLSHYRGIPSIKNATNRTDFLKDREGSKYRTKAFFALVS